MISRLQLGTKVGVMGDENEWANVLLSTSEHKLLGISSPEGVAKEILLVCLPLTIVQKRLGFVLRIFGSVVIKKVDLSTFKASE